MTGVSKQRLVYIDTAKGVGMSMIVWMHIWGNNSYGFTPQAVRKRHFEAYHSWQSRYCDST